MGATWIITNIHFDKLYKQLSPDLQLLYFQLLTHPNRNKAGFYQIDIDVHRILRKGKSEEECRAELETETGLWLYDRANDLVLIPTYLKYNKVGSGKTFQSIKYELEELPSSELCIEFIYRVNEYTEGKGLEYLPTKMIKCAKAILSQKKDLSLHEVIVKKILTFNS